VTLAVLLDGKDEHQGAVIPGVADTWRRRAVSSVVER
jgi:hypothetical protein